MIKLDFIQELYPNAVRYMNGIAYDSDGNEVAYDNAAVEALVASKAYIDNRLAEYPSIGDQLDMIYRAGLGGDEFQAAIAAVKTTYPKPE